MEAETISKNGASPKSRMSRGKILMMGMLMCLLLSSPSAFADDSGTCGSGVTYKYTSSNKTLVISGSGEMENYRTYGRAPWSSYKASIENVSIGNGVTHIGNYAFYGCTNLWGFSTNNTSVISIGQYAFFDCDKLQEILDLDNLFTALESIGNYAFADCDGFKSIRLMKNIKTVGDYAFSNCSGDTLLRIGSSVTSIGRGAFEKCGRLRTVEFEDGPKPISVSNESASYLDNGYSAFSGCKINRLHIGRPFDSPYGYYAFQNHTDLTTLTFGDDVTSIGYNAFSGCTDLTDVTLGRNVTSIGNNAFASCGFASITIPAKVESIGEDAFSECSELTSIIIPKNVTSIERNAFGNCRRLKTVEFEDGPKPISIYYWKRSYDAFFDCPITTLHIGRPFSTSLYRYGAFNSKATLTTLTLGEDVTAIGNDDFSDCINLSQIVSKNIIPPSTGSNCFTNVNKQTCKLYVPAAAVNAYKAANVWKDFYNILAGSSSAIAPIEPPSVKAIPNSATGELIIESPNLNISNETAFVYNTQGREILSRRISEGNVLNVAHLPAGVYILKIGAYSSKFIKK
jgi:hypothetical protein